MSDDQRQDGSTSNNGAFNNDVRNQDNAISWSIHAAHESDDDAGSSSSGSSEGRATGVSQRQREEQQANQEAIANDHALRLAHAMTHNPVDALLPSPPRSPPRAIPNPYAGFTTSYKVTDRVITVDDIKNKNCWICSDGDADEVESKNAEPRRWIHPCKCTLVAHKDCLLMWIRTTRASDPRKPIQCPQCSQPYIIIEQKPFSLRILDAGQKFLRDLLPIATAGVMGGGILVAATAYGCAAIRLWAGKDVAGRLLHGRWPWHYYIDIPVIPFALLLSRFRIMEPGFMSISMATLIPQLNFLFFTSELTSPSSLLRSFAGRRRPWDHRNSHQQASLVSTHRSYPPGPMLTLLLVPWARAVYMMLKLRVTRKVLKPFSRRRDGQPARNTTNQGERVRQTRLIVIGDDPPGETLDQDGVVNVDEDGNLRDLPPGAEAIENGRTVYVTPQSLAKACLGALSSPIIANLMGKLLARVARYSTFLRRFLGIDSFPPSISLNYQRPSVTQKTNSMTPLKRLFSTGSLFAPEKAEQPIPPSFASQPIYDDSGDGMAWYWTSNSYDDLDPVWFRNAIGAGIFVVIKDILQLRYRYLKLEHAREGAKRTRIGDRPFVGGIVKELELRDELRGRQSHHSSI